MILVVGGIASGKRTYVRSLGYEDEQVAYDLQKTLREGPLTPKAFDELTHRKAIVCTEVGLGVVPMNSDERAWRELVGRTCCELSKRADKVVRMVCGIPVVIKEKNA